MKLDTSTPPISFTLPVNLYAPWDYEIRCMRLALMKRLPVTLPVSVCIIWTLRSALLSGLIPFRSITEVLCTDLENNCEVCVAHEIWRACFILMTRFINVEKGEGINGNRLLRESTRTRRTPSSTDRFFKSTYKCFDIYPEKGSHSICPLLCFVSQPRRTLIENDTPLPTLIVILSILSLRSDLVLLIHFLHPNIVCSITIQWSKFNSAIRCFSTEFF